VDVVECLLWKEDLRPRLVFMNAKVKVNDKARTYVSCMAEGGSLLGQTLPKRSRTLTNTERKYFHYNLRRQFCPLESTFVFGT
jgi:hypothetical protein